jgi:hypothetical protein
MDDKLDKNDDEHKKFEGVSAWVSAHTWVIGILIISLLGIIFKII